MLVVSTALHDSQTEYCSIQIQIDAAHNCITVAETLLSQKFQHELQKIAKIDAKIAEYTKLNDKPVCDKEEEVSLKKLFKKIANLTHPDKCGNDALFIEAKKALKANNREALNSLLNQATSDYDELLKLKRAEYEAIINSEEYNVAHSYLNGDNDLKRRVEQIYCNNINHKLQLKIAILGNIIANF